MSLRAEFTERGCRLIRRRRLPRRKNAASHTYAGIPSRHLGTAHLSPWEYQRVSLNTWDRYTLAVYHQIWNLTLSSYSFDYFQTVSINEEIMNKWINQNWGQVYLGNPIVFPNSDQLSELRYVEAQQTTGISERSILSNQCWPPLSNFK